MTERSDTFRALCDQARRAIDTFRDATREGRILDFRQRDPLVVVLHAVVDRYEELAGVAPPPPAGEP